MRIGRAMRAAGARSSGRRGDLHVGGEPGGVGAVLQEVDAVARDRDVVLAGGGAGELGDIRDRRARRGVQHAGLHGVSPSGWRPGGRGAPEKFLLASHESLE